MSQQPLEWTDSCLADTVQLQRGHDLPTPQRRSGTIPILGSFGVTGHHDRALYPGPGVTIGRSGASIGTATFTTDDYWPLNTALFVRDFKGNDPRWVYYLLDGIDFSGFNSGSAQPSLNRNFLSRIPVRKPPVAEQRRIAATLGALDDKIESDRRQASLALALLDSLVEEFAEDHAEEIALDALAAASRSLLDPRSLGDEWFDHFSIPAFDSHQLPERVPGRTVISSKLTVREPSVLLSRLNPKTNRTWFAVPEPGVPAGCSTEFLVLTPRPGLSLGALWLAVRDAFFRDSLAQRATGTSGSHQRVGPADVLGTLVPDVRALPPERLVQANALLALVHQRRVESARLAAMRAALLPELMSGRLRVPEASEALG